MRLDSLKKHSNSGRWGTTLWPDCLGEHIFQLLFKPSLHVRTLKIDLGRGYLLERIVPLLNVTSLNSSLIAAFHY